MLLRLLFCLVFLTLLSGFACDLSKKTAAPSGKDKDRPRDSTGLVWMDSERLMPVLELAQQQNRPVFVEFYADWCAPCKVMEEELFTEPIVYAYFNRYFLNFRTNIDSESGQMLAGLYTVESLPTILYLNPQGVVLERLIGGITFAKLEAAGNAAMQKMR